MKEVTLMKRRIEPKFLFEVHNKTVIIGTVDYMKLTRTNSENHNGLRKGSTGKNIIIMQIEKWNTSLV